MNYIHNIYFIYYKYVECSCNIIRYDRLTIGLENYNVYFSKTYNSFDLG